MVNYQEKIKSVLQRRGIPQDEFAVKIGLSVSAFKKQIRANNLPVKTLDTICTELKISPSVFFSYDFKVSLKEEEDPKAYYSERKREMDLDNCLKLVSEKEVQIALLKDKILLLEEKIEYLQK